MSDDRELPPSPPPPPRNGGAGAPGATPATGAEPVEVVTTGDAAPDSPRRSSLLRSSALMASGTMVSRVLGFVRNFLLIACIGSAAGSVSAAFGVANNLPNTVYNVLAAGVLDAILVPQIVRALKSRSGDVYINRLITLAGTILFAVTVLAMVASPLLVTVFSHGFSGELRSLSIAFTLLCLPQMFFYGIYNLFGQLLNARGIFGPYMWAPVVNNVVGIAGLGLFLVLWGPSQESFRVEDFTSAQFWVLAGSSTIGVILQALVLIVPMRRAGVRLRPDFHFRGTSFGSASKVAGWTFANLGVSQLGIISTSNLATQADRWASLNNAPIAGYVSYTTAFMIFMVPQSLVAVSVATAIFTRMADAAARHDGRTLAHNYQRGVQLITMLNALVVAIFMAGALPLMQLALPPATSPEMATAYAHVLFALMPGVIGTGIILMTVRVFYAIEDARPVFLMGLVPAAVQIVVAWTIHAVADPAQWTVGAAISETVGRLLQAVIGIVWVASVVRQVNPGRMFAFLIRYSSIAFVSFMVGLGAIHLLGPTSDPGSTGARYLMAGGKLLLVALVVTVVYALFLRLLEPGGAWVQVAGVLARFPVPAPLRRHFAGVGTTDGHNGEAQSRQSTEDPMAQNTDAEGSTSGIGAGNDDVESPGRDSLGEDPWQGVGRAMSASDPTNTGEFPLIRTFSLPHGTGTPHASLPTFDEILDPDNAAEGRGPEQHVDGVLPESSAPSTPEHVSPRGDRPHGDGRHTETGIAEGSVPGDEPVLGADHDGADDDAVTPPPDAADTGATSPTVAQDPGTPVPSSEGTTSGAQQDPDAEGPTDQDLGTLPDLLPPPPPPAATAAASGGTAQPSTGVHPEDAATVSPPPDEQWRTPGIAGAGVADAQGTGVPQPGTSAPSGEQHLPVPEDATRSSVPSQSTDEPPSPGDRDSTSPDGTEPHGPAHPGPAGAEDLDTAAAAEDSTSGATTVNGLGGLAAGLGVVAESANRSLSRFTSRVRAVLRDSDAHAQSSATAGDESAAADAGGNEPGGEPPHAFAAAPEDTIVLPAPGAPLPGQTSDDLPRAHTPQSALPPSDPSHTHTSVTAAGAPGPSGTGSTTPPPAAPARRGSPAGRINPTIPTLIFAGILVVVGGVWGVNTALEPVGAFDLPSIPAQSGEQSGQQSGEQSGSASEETAAPEEPDVVTPEIATPTIFSWRDDGGDNPDSVMNMFDGDPSTEWHSRSYSLNDFDPTRTVTILLTLKERAPVSEITLTMAPETSGGELVVRDVSDDPSDPRTGTELATSALSPQTTITLPESTELTALSLSFRTMPTGPNGENWAWIYELAVR